MAPSDKVISEEPGRWRIALVSPYDFPYPGGVTSHVMGLGRQLRRLGHDVTILAPSSVPSDPSTEFNHIRLGGVLPIRANGSIARVGFGFGVAATLRRVLIDGRFDLVHLHEPLVPGLCTSILRHSRSANIGTFHATWEGRVAALSGNPLTRRFARLLHSRIAVSDRACEIAIRRFGGDYDIIPNGVDIERFAGDQCRSSMGTGDQPSILFLGRLEERKGLTYLLRATRRLAMTGDDVRLIVAGPSPPNIVARYRREAAAAGVTNVTFVGRILDNELPRLYSACDIFCAPSVGGESQGIVLLEAKAAGRPIVATEITGYQSVLTPGLEGVLVPPRDEIALAEALRRMVRDEDLRRRLGGAGLVTAQQYAWPRVARQIVSHYRLAHVSWLRSQSAVPIGGGLRRHVDRLSRGMLLSPARSSSIRGGT